MRKKETGKEARQGLLSQVGDIGAVARRLDIPPSAYLGIVETLIGNDEFQRRPDKEAFLEILGDPEDIFTRAQEDGFGPWAARLANDLELPGFEEPFKWEVLEGLAREIVFESGEKSLSAGERAVTIEKALLSSLPELDKRFGLPAGDLPDLMGRTIGLLGISGRFEEAALLSLRLDREEAAIDFLERAQEFGPEQVEAAKVKVELIEKQLELIKDDEEREELRKDLDQAILDYGGRLTGAQRFLEARLVFLRLEESGIDLEALEGSSEGLMIEAIEKKRQLEGPFEAARLASECSTPALETSLYLEAAKEGNALAAKVAVQTALERAQGRQAIDIARRCGLFRELSITLLGQGYRTESQDYVHLADLVDKLEEED